MKVIHVIASIDKSTGGPARSVPQTCIELAKLGIEIEIITQKSENPVPTPNLPNLKISFKSISQLYRYGKQLSKKNIDLIHIQHIWTPYVNVMGYWAKKKKIPYLITPRGMLEPWIMNRNPWKKKLAMLLYQNKIIENANHLHVTALMEQENIERLGYSNPMTIIPNGIDLSEVKKVKTNYGSKKMVFLSRIHPKKGIELLLETWGNLKTEGWTLEIAGNGDHIYVEELRRQADKLKDVKFVGSKYGEDKWDFIRSADVMILPTYSENFGIVVAEALAVGVPVITTKGTPWQDLEMHNCGWWIDLSIGNLQKTLNEVIQLPKEKIKRKGENGIELIQSKYRIEAVAKDVENLYSEVKKI